MQRPVWRFRRMERAELNTNPVEGEFFTPQGISDALVREAIQNSLDARIPGASGPVQVRFRFSGDSEALEPAKAGTWLRGLGPHLAAQSEIQLRRSDSDPLPYLAIEDFGTRGLTGDPLQEEDHETAREEKNNFYYFWRNVGRSAKEEKDLGRWGLGKTVFPATSLINSFFGITCRAGDGRRLLMGQSVLTVHKIGSERRYPYGYFARYEDQDTFAIPIEADALLDDFCGSFGLERDHKPGLSVVIPEPDPELKPADVIRSAIVQYFYPIIAGELIVDVQTGEHAVHLDSSTIDRITAELGPSMRFNPETLRNLYELARWAQALPSGERIELVPTGAGNAATWSEALFPSGSLELLQRRWERGERIAVRAWLPVQKRSTPARETAFDLYLQRDDSLSHSEEHYVRQGITIPGIKLVRERTVRGLLVVEDPLLSSLLGDSENPAHTDWQARRPIIKQRYERGASSIGFVRGALREVVRLLSRPPESRDENLLRDIFYVDVEPDPSARAQRTKRKLPKPAKPPEPRSIPFKIEKRRGGFEVIGNPEVVQAGDRIVVKAAYRTRRGDPFAAYSPFDFRFGSPPIRIGKAGVHVDAVEENRLDLRIEIPAFRVAFDGFDVRRDLVVSARRAGGSGT